MKMNKKGLLVEVLVFIIIGFIALIFFAAWKYGINFVNTEIMSIETTSNMTNISYAAEQNFGYYNSAMDSLGIIAACLLLGFIIATFIVGYFASENPVFFLIYFFICAILLTFSVYISNAYEELLSNDVIGTTLQDFTIGTHIMLHLPIYSVVLIFVGSLLMFGGYLVRREYA